GPGQQPVDGDEGAHILLGRRSIHQHGAIRPPPQPLIAPERGIAGQRRTLAIAPTLDVKKCCYLAGALFFHGNTLSSRAAQRPRPVRMTFRLCVCTPLGISRPISRRSAGSSAPNRSGHSTREMPSAKASSISSSIASPASF